MIIYMFKEAKNICITNRKLVKGNLLDQLEDVIRLYKIDWIVLREKDLSEFEYECLGALVKKLCDRYQIECYFHNQLKLAQKYGAAGVHLSYQQLPDFRRSMWKDLRVGCSVHSMEEALFAQSCGVDYLFVSPIYETDCKPGVKAKTPLFITEMKSKVKLPVYALGGINAYNRNACIEAGADGVCMMSAYMNEIMEE